MLDEPVELPEGRPQGKDGLVGGTGRIQIEK